MKFVLSTFSITMVSIKSILEAQLLLFSNGLIEKNKLNIKYLHYEILKPKQKDSFKNKFQ